jgi:hypothetical protein
MCQMSSGILIGYLPEQVYVPLSTSGLPISFYFQHSCEECLCRAIMSTTMTFVAINCMTVSHTCEFHTSYAKKFTLEWNSSACLYFLQAPPGASIPVTILETATVEITSKQ